MYFRLVFPFLLCSGLFSESSARSEQDLNSSFLADDASSVLSFGSAGDAPTRSLTPTSSNSAGEGRRYDTFVELEIEIYSIVTAVIVSSS